MKKSRSSFALPIASAIFFLISSAAGAQGWDPDPTWPLCGNVNKPSAPYTCLPGKADIVNDTYGPRCMDSYSPGCAGGEHDWHFGIDLHPAEPQMPVFASTCGQVKTIDTNLGVGNNQKVIIEHYRSWATSCPSRWAPWPTTFPSCSGGNCYYTVYNHLSELPTTLATGQFMPKSGYVGLTGQNCDEAYPCLEDDGVTYSKYEHLHYEVLDPTAGDLYVAGYNYSRNQREAIHPLRFLERASWDDDADNIAVSFHSVDTTSPLDPTPTIEVTIDLSKTKSSVDRELDLNRVEVRAFDVSDLKTGPVLIVQPNETFPALPTPEQLPGGGNVAYEVNPPFLDMELMTRQYSYANGNTYFPYTAFISDEHHSAPDPYASPYSFEYLGGVANPLYDPVLKNGYQWGYHMHLAHPTQPERGQFNGSEIVSEPFNRHDDIYTVRFTFTEIIGTSQIGDLCLQARAEDAFGNFTAWVDYGPCPAGLP